jgi:hypothetical protein
MIEESVNRLDDVIKLLVKKAARQIWCLKQLPSATKG